MYYMTKIIYLLLCVSVLFSCDYNEKKTKENEIILLKKAIEEQSAKLDEIIKQKEIEEQKSSAKQKEIEMQEQKKQDIKNNIAKYVFIGNGILINNTDYTIDEIVYEYNFDSLYENGKWKPISKTGSIYYLPAHSSISIASDAKIISIKCQPLEIN